MIGTNTDLFGAIIGNRPDVIAALIPRVTHALEIRMDTLAIEQEIYNAIRRVKPSLETMALTPLTRFDELGLESLERTVVLFEIEDVYAISIVEQNLDTFETIAQARDVVATLIGKAAAHNARSGGRTA